MNNVRLRNCSISGYTPQNRFKNCSINGCTPQRVSRIVDWIVMGFCIFATGLFAGLVWSAIQHGAPGF